MDILELSDLLLTWSAVENKQKKFVSEKSVWGKGKIVSKAQCVLI